MVRGSGKQKIGALINLGAYYLAGIPSGALLAFVYHVGGKVTHSTLSLSPSVFSYIYIYIYIYILHLHYKVVAICSYGDSNLVLHYAPPDPLTLSRASLALIFHSSFYSSGRRKK